MPSISLIIKGNRATAEHETARRNLGPATIQGEITNGYTVLTVLDNPSNREILQTWFLEHHSRFAPYPPNSLLSYTFHPNNAPEI